MDKKKSPRADGGQQGGQIPNSSTDILGPSLPWRNGTERTPEVWHSAAGGFAEWMAARIDSAALDSKKLATLRAQFALAGHELLNSKRTDGTPCLLATRWGLTRELADLDEARAFLRQIGG